MILIVIRIVHRLAFPCAGLPPAPSSGGIVISQLPCAGLPLPEDNVIQLGKVCPALTCKPANFLLINQRFTNIDFSRVASERAPAFTPYQLVNLSTYQLVNSPLSLLLTTF